MCLYSELRINKKYIPNAKNRGNPPVLLDNRVKYVPVACGQCIECRKKKSRDWQIRLHEEIKKYKNGVFVTLTFNNESLEKYREKVIKAADGENIIDDNLTATFAVRHFLERWRKKYKKSVRHWLVTELGHQNTERIHLHGIIFTDHREDIEKIWGNGWVYIGDYVSGKTVNYIVKYITKIDIQHKDFMPKILCSKGIGSSYINSYNAKLNNYKEKETRETYTHSNGSEVSLPIYYRNKIYNESEKERLWINKIEEHTRYVLGVSIDISTQSGITRYNKLVSNARIYQKKMGYSGKIDNDLKTYNSRLREINRNRNKNSDE